VTSWRLPALRPPRGASRAADGPWSTALLNVLAILGAGVTIGVIGWGISDGQFGVPGGDVVSYMAAGQRLAHGAVVYAGAWNAPGTVYYAPPIIVAFGALAVLPAIPVWLALCAVDLLGLRYLAGSWRAAGLWGLVPLTAFELVGGNPNIAIVAAILMAARRSAGPLALATLVKLGPVFGLPRRGVRTFAIWMLVALAITLPWLGLWPQWLSYLLTAPLSGAWPVIVPLIVRAPIAVVLLALRKDWARMLAACLLIPGFYIVTAYSTLILVTRLLVDLRAERLARDQSPPGSPIPTTTAAPSGGNSGARPVRNQEAPLSGAHLD
jgi:hypothetical protein